MTKLIDVLRSDGFSPIIEAIKRKQYSTAEILLHDTEIDHDEHKHEYTASENNLILSAFEECWKRIK